MHEKERDAALTLISSPQLTASFVMGDVDEGDISKLQNAGLIVQESPAPVVQEGAGAAPGLRPRTLSSSELGAPGAFEDAVPAAVDYYVIRLRGRLIEPWRANLNSIGVTLLEALPDGGYTARLRREQVPTVRALDFIESVTWISPARSAPRIIAEPTLVVPGRPPESAVKMLTFDVRLHLPEDRPKVEQWLRENHVAIAGSSGRKIRIFALENSPDLAKLALLPEVDTIAEYVAPKLFNEAARRLLGIDAPTGSPAPISLTQDGADQTVAVADTGIDTQHPDFQGRVVGTIARGRPGDASDPHGHGTHVAGSVLGDGAASNGQLKGVAPKAKLFFQSLLDGSGGLGGLPIDLNVLFDEAYQAGARIHNNSWGADTSSFYTINSEEVDEFVSGHRDMLIVVAAGNAGTGAQPVRAAPGFVDWLSIGSPASCKNALTVGASRSDRTDGSLSKITWGAAWPTSFPTPPIASQTVSGDPECLAAFSSRGPCDDRRIKPDVVAPGTDIASTRSSLAPLSNFWGTYSATPGQPPNPHYAFDGGTSMATPLVSGCAALVRQYYLQERNHQPSAALLKATLINSTTWLSGADSTAPSPGKPNYHQGHGRVCMQVAIPNRSQPGLNLQFIDNWQEQASYFTVTGDRRRYQFTLPRDVPELRITMAYTDVPGRALQNNVNLMVQHLDSGKKWLGNENLPDPLTLPDPDNNVETVRLQKPPNGDYMIQVFVGNMLKPPQDFALVVTGVGVSQLTPV
jgi:subtilisin family serine protease